MAKRLTKELNEFTKQSLDWCTVGLIDDDLMKWNAIITGPEESPFAGGVFNIELVFPTEYPFKGPKLRFLTKVYHPNIKTGTGEICSDLITGSWTPTLSVMDCLITVRQLLKEPNPDNPLEPEIARQLQENPSAYEDAVRKFVRDYAQ